MPHIDYRQHTGNVQGANNSLAAALRRIGGLFKGQYAAWTQTNLAGLDAIVDQLPATSQHLIALAKTAHEGGFFARMRAFAVARFYRQTIVGTLGVLAAIALRRF